MLKQAVIETYSLFIGKSLGSTARDPTEVNLPLIFFSIDVWWRDSLKPQNTQKDFIVGFFSIYKKRQCAIATMKTTIIWFIQSFALFSCPLLPFFSFFILLRMISSSPLYIHIEREREREPLVNTINCHNIFTIVEMLIPYRSK